MLNGWPIDALEDALRRAMPPARAPVAFERVREIDSTNSELLRRARAGQSAPVLLAADRQTAGRGRLGRQWTSGDPGESLAFSLLWPLVPRDWSGLSLALGVALADALDPAQAHGIGLKWPNDLWLRGRKLAGILIETAACAGATSAQPPRAPQAQRRCAVIGIGINLGAPRGAEQASFSTPPAWLREIAPDADAAGTLLRIAGPLVAALREFETLGFAAFQRRFETRDVLRGQPVEVVGNAQGAALSGIARGVREDGALLVGTDGGMQPVSSLEVRVRPADSASASR